MKKVELVEIVIVDDEPFMRSTIKHLLRGLGNFAVHEAGDGESGLRMVAVHRPQLILCDIAMAPMNGLQFVEQLRANADPTLAGIPVVMLTARADRTMVERAVRIGIHGYLLKPVSRQQLGARLAAVLPAAARGGAHVLNPPGPAPYR